MEIISIISGALLIIGMNIYSYREGYIRGYIDGKEDSKWQK